MTITMLLPNIADSISQISIDGITVKDVNELSGSWKNTNHILYPNPEQPGWITNFKLNYQSILKGANAPVDISYTLNYRYLSVAIGDVAQFPKAYNDLVNEVASIVAAIMGVPSPYSGKVGMEIGNVILGGRKDLAGNDYHGADIQLLITEQQN